MLLSQELTEYGLTIEDQHLKSTSCICGKPLQPVLGKDWLFCRSCRSGHSRVELASPEWAQAQPESIKAKLQLYYQAVINQARYAEAVWSRLATGLEAEYKLSRLSLMQDYARVATNHTMLSLITKWSVGSLPQLEPPVFVLKLEDTPGRITGFALVAEAVPGAHVDVVRYAHQGARVAFLQNLEAPVVNVDDPGLLLRLQCRSMATTSSLMPLAYAQMSGPDWYPLTNGGYIVQAKTLDEQLLSTMADSGGLLRLHSLSSQPHIHLSPTTAKQWYGLVCKETAEWAATAANFLADVSPDVAAILVAKAKLPELAINRILSRCQPDVAGRLRAAFKRQPAHYRLSESRSIFDNGVQWTNHKGEIVLSGSLRIDKVEEEDDKPVYHCTVVTEQGAVSFVCGKELERDGLAVTMRKCLLQGVSLTYLQSYSRHALQIAVGLRPVRKLSIANTALNLA